MLGTQSNTLRVWIRWSQRERSVCTNRSTWSKLLWEHGSGGSCLRGCESQPCATVLAAAAAEDAAQKQEVELRALEEEEGRSRVPAWRSDAGDSKSFRRRGCFAEGRCCRSQEEGRAPHQWVASYRWVASYSSNFCADSTKVLGERSMYGGWKCWTCDHAQIYHEVWWFVRLSKAQQWWRIRKLDYFQSSILFHTMTGANSFRTFYIMYCGSKGTRKKRSQIQHKVIEYDDT